MPSFQKQYPDLTKEDLEKLISFKWTKQGQRGGRRASPVRSSGSRPSYGSSKPAASYSSSSSASSIGSKKGDGFFPETVFTPQLPQQESSAVSVMRMC
jgi:hypothetical protein